MVTLSSALKIANYLRRRYHEIVKVLTHGVDWTISRIYGLRQIHRTAGDGQV